MTRGFRCDICHKFFAGDPSAKMEWTTIVSNTKTGYELYEEYCSECYKKYEDWRDTLRK